MHTAKPMQPLACVLGCFCSHLPSCLQVRLMDASLQQYVPTDILDTTEGFGYDLDLNDLMVSMPALLLAFGQCFLAWPPSQIEQGGDAIC